MNVNNRIHLFGTFNMGPLGKLLIPESEIAIVMLFLNEVTHH